MKEEKVKKIFNLSKKRKSQIERGFNYWTALFLGIGIAMILFAIDAINEIIINAFQLNRGVILKFVEVLILFGLWISSGNEFFKRLLAIELKEEKITSLKKAKEYLKEKK